MAYRRFRSRKSATGYARASYSEVYDMHTEFGKTTLLGIHTPVTSRWQYLLEGFVKQYKKFRYKGASVSFVPVATLPADPLQVSYEAGEPTIDPRDMMNPIIHCGMRGQSMGNYLDEIFHMNISHALSSLDVVDIDNSSSLQDLENAYYSALMSPSFRKSHPQQGFRKAGLHPMVYQLTTNMPYNFVSDGSYGTDAIHPNDPSVSTMGFMDVNSKDLLTDVDASNVVFTSSANDISARSLGAQFIKAHPASGSLDDYHVGQFFTNKLTSLGWLDTIQRHTVSYVSGGATATVNQWTNLPKVYMYFVMLPPAYKTEMYYRVIVKHYFEFKGFRTTTQPFASDSGIVGIYDGPIQNEPVGAMEVASIDIYNGEASLLTDGVM